MNSSIGREVRWETVDKQKGKQLYEENVKAVYKYLFCLTHNADLAEELTQETFYQAMKGMDKFRGECKISVWLCQIGKRLWYKELERKKKKGTAALDENMVSDKKPLDEELCIREEKMELFKKVHVLDETAKEVVLLRLTGAFSFREIAELFGKNENWARVTFYRAKQKIMEEMEGSK